MLTHTLGFPRMGRQRELKQALEAHWKGELPADALEAAARQLRLRHWRLQQDAGIDLLPVGDFSLYDHMLDLTAMLGAVPERFGAVRDGDGATDPAAYFLMARGGQRQGRGVAPLEMSKWFDTNYHYLVPELAPDQAFAPQCAPLLAQAAEARALGAPIKAVLPGPFTFLCLAKSAAPGADRFACLPALLDAYATLLSGLAPACDWVQLDEPVLAMDLPGACCARFRDAYARLLEAARPARLMLATYFGSIAPNLGELAGLPLDCLHLDLARAPEQLAGVLKSLHPDTALSLGVVDGRNIWRVDAARALALVRRAADALTPDRVLVAPSCSLLHAPLDLADETALDPAIRQWMAFAVQKCGEVRLLADAALGKAAPAALEENAAAWAARRESALTRDAAVRGRCAGITPAMLGRSRPHAARKQAQQERLGLPLLPTTTIGSFPQTAAVRAARRKFRQGETTGQDYRAAMQNFIAEAVARQEELGLDVLVHGEPERNDMVEYFGEQLAGFCFTQNGWVQSYGSRCVKPPVIYGDVSRPRPMTVEWFRHAQSLTRRPMKGMLTGPVTILCWSFVRDDQPRSATCRQIALAVRDEVLDLETAGAAIIQIDEPALREGLPLRREDHEAYLRWAVDCFRLAANGVRDQTQVHTHMCYAEFNEIIAAIAEMDADVISIEASRSRMELLEAFSRFRYPNDMGPGVYDIHSPRVPPAEEMADLLRRAAAVVPVEQLWVNPDCGLKTRDWPETLASLRNLVQAAATLRRELASAGAGAP